MFLLGFDEGLDEMDEVVVVVFEYYCFDWVYVDGFFVYYYVVFV